MIFGIILLFVLHYAVAENTNLICGDFYWRDYDGTIPNDALPAGNNSKGFSYIGQGYVHNYGLLMGTIIPGKMEIEIPCYGVKRTNSIIKILCTQNKNNYSWIPTTIDNYKKVTLEVCPVIGGYDQRGKEHLPLGTLNIGRTRKHGDVIIGNIAAYDRSYKWFYYPLYGMEMKTFEYEMLVYTGPSVKEE